MGETARVPPKYFLLLRRHRNRYPNSRMESFITLNDGTQFPWPVYGSGTTLRDKDVSKQILDAINAGFRHIDCAQMYNNEGSVGEGIAQSGVLRAELYITTKLIPVPEGKTAKDTLRKSLRKMQLDYVDLFLVHLPIDHNNLSVTWKEMEECKALGLARSIGVSNFRIQDFEEIRQSATSIPVINQVSIAFLISSWLIIQRLYAD